MSIEPTGAGVETIEQVGGSAPSVRARFVTVELADDWFGVEIGAVRGIHPVTPITRVPRSAPEMAGLMNRRGRILPVFDLRRGLGLPGADPGERARVAVIEQGGHEAGFIVDGVHGVVELDPGAIDAGPGLVMTGSAGVVRGVAPLEERLLIVLDLGGLFKALNLACTESAA